MNLPGLRLVDVAAVVARRQEDAQTGLGHSRPSFQRWTPVMVVQVALVVAVYVVVDYCGNGPSCLPAVLVVVAAAAAVAAHRTQMVAPNGRATWTVFVGDFGLAADGSTAAEKHRSAVRQRVEM